MCGIVLLGGNALSSTEVGRFEKLLFADTFRGPHSTGVFTKRKYGFKPEDPEAVEYYKDALDGPDYLKTSGWEALKRGTEKTPKHGNFYVGHNRYATMGAVNGKNAHPFQHGNITLVHNGTLTQQSLLPDHLQFEVDSENVCHSINKIGAAETIQKLNGAFTLIWHDMSDDTLHIIRNEERPFHIAECAGGTFYGASEEDMLMWILKRGRATPTIQKHYEIEVGKEYVFDTSNNRFAFKEVIEHKLPNFPSAYGYGYGNYGNGYSSSTRYGGYAGTGGSTTLGRSSTVLSGKQAKNNGKQSNDHPANKVLREAGIDLKVGGFVSFTGFSWGKYQNKENVGLVEGYLEDWNEYVEVHGHQCAMGNYRKYGGLRGQIVSAFVENGVTTILVNKPIMVQAMIPVPEIKDFNLSEDDDLGLAFLELKKDLEEASESVACDGGTYTRAQWEQSQHNSCGNCSSAIAFEDLKSVTWYNGEPVCHGCYDQLMGELADEEYKKSLKSFTFKCKICGETTDINNEGTTVGVCSECDSGRTTPAPREILSLKKPAVVCGDGTNIGCKTNLTTKGRFYNNSIDLIPLCAHCWSDYQAAVKTGNAPKIVKPKKPLKGQKVLVNGEIVTRKKWRKMNTCQCGTRIPFNECEKTLILDNNKAVCGDCESQLI